MREIQEDKLYVPDYETPIEYKEVKEKFQKAKDEGQRVLLECNELNLAHSVVIELVYIGERWCMGNTIYYQGGKRIAVPYTIHYGDLYTAKTPNSTSRNTKIIFEGANPFGTGLGEGSKED